MIDDGFPTFRWEAIMRGCSPSLFILATILCLANSSLGADPAFVGALSLIAEDDVAKELALEPTTREKLLKVIEDRENEALELVLELKNLTAAEQREKLVPFVAESEKQGFAILSPLQQTKLKQLRIARGGLTTLREAGVAESLGLTAAQREQIEQRLTELDAKSRAGTEEERRVAKAEAERQLAQLLNKDQRASWEKLAGRVPAEAVAVANEPPPAPVEEKVSAVEIPAVKEAVQETAKMVDTKPALAPPAATGDNARLRFSFRFTPWKDVLDWFAQQADLSLVLDAPPPGTFNYSDNRNYSPAEAIDLLNSVLLTKGYTLIRRGRMLLVINLEDGIPPNLVPQVSAEELDKKGEYELVSCIFPLGKFAPEDADKEIRPLLGPQGALLVLPKAKQLYVTETAGKLRTIRRILQQVEPANTGADDKIAAFKLKHILPSELMTIARPLLGIPENVNSTPDGSLRISVDELNGRLLITGKPERVQKMNDLITMLDAEPDNTSTPLTAIESPQLEVYTVTTADPDTVLQVLRTLLGGFPDVRLDKDVKTGNIVALARPSQHATIKATIDQMQKDPRLVEVVKLRKLDPQVAVLAINKMFGGSEEGAAASGPKVDADPTSLQLIIRGSQSQIEQIRELLGKMGEISIDEKSQLTERSNLRTIPLTGRAAASALEQIQSLWPTVHANKIRTVTPSKSSSLRVPLPSAGREPQLPREENEERLPPVDPLKLRKSASMQDGIQARFVAFQKPASSTADKPAEEKPPVQKTVPGAEIVVTIGPGGIIIASEDLDALDAFEEMMRQVASQTEASGKEYTVFYLRFAKADAAVEIVQQAMGGSSGSSDAGGGGSLMGDLASSFLGSQGGLLGGLMGGLGGGGGSSGGSGPVSMTPDPRLNAILCYGRPSDLDLVEQMLKVVDQESSPEDVLTNGRPRFIPVINADAEEVSALVKQVYSNRIAADASQPKQPSPEEFIRALRGGGGGGRGGSTAKKSEEQKMSLGVDKRSNSLIVSAPDPLFQEVKQLVEQLDVASNSKDESVSVVSIKRANPELVEKALNSLVGSNATVSRQANKTATNANRSSGEQRPQSSEQMQDEIRRRMETFNALQQEVNRGGNRGGQPGGGAGGFAPRRGN